MKTKLFISVSIIVIFVVGSCNIYNPSEPVPSYIHIDNITVSIPTTMQGSGGFGSASSKITDAWVYIDGQLIGCFQMPCTVPALYDGLHTLMIRPGIKVNGIAATRAPYPFYDNYYQAVNLSRGSITNITNVTVPYLSNLVNPTNFPHIADFDAQGTLMERTINSTSSLKPLLPPYAFEGNSALGVTHSINEQFECSFDSVPLFGGGTNVFVEMNYKCNTPITVSMIGYTVSGVHTVTNVAPQSEVLTLNPSDTWNKVYVYLTPTMIQFNTYNANYYKILFGITNYGGLDSAWCAFDNIKIVQ